MGKKDDQLGMSHSTASHRLRKLILFSLINQTCHRCKEKIESVKELSIEHKIAWQDSSDPVGLFFDLGNIAFSHLSCNSGSRRNVPESKHGTLNRYMKYKCRCDDCRKHKAEYIKGR